MLFNALNKLFVFFSHSGVLQHPSCMQMFASVSAASGTSFFAACSINRSASLLCICF